MRNFLTTLLGVSVFFITVSVADAAVSICGERVFAASPAVYIYTSGTYYRCIAAYESEGGRPKDLPGFDYICVTGSSTTYKDFGSGAGPSSGYDIANCQVNVSSSKCSPTKRYVNETTGCTACGDGAYATTSTSGYHRNAVCAYCDPSYRYVSNNVCVACSSDRWTGVTEPHQRDTCYCKDGKWDDGTNCNECPCGGTTAWPGDIDACYLASGKSCSDETGSYTVSGPCYYSKY